MRTDPSPGAVLDASALLAYLQRERGFERVGAALGAGAAISAVNMAEVYGKAAEAHLRLAPLAARLRALGLRVEPFRHRDAAACARLHRATRPFGLSLADRACLALGARLGVAALTCDGAWARVRGARIELLR